MFMCKRMENTLCNGSKWFQKSPKRMRALSSAGLCPCLPAGQCLDAILLENKHITADTNLLFFIEGGMSGPQLGRPPEEWREICTYLQIPYDENENEDAEMENLPTDHIPPSYDENEDSEPHLLGLKELYADCAPLELCSPHSEDSILKTKGEMRIEPIESYEVGNILAYFFSSSNRLSSNRLQNIVSFNSACTSRELATSKSVSLVKVLN